MVEGYGVSSGAALRTRDLLLVDDVEADRNGDGSAGKRITRPDPECVLRLNPTDMGRPTFGNVTQPDLRSERRRALRILRKTFPLWCAGNRFTHESRFDSRGNRQIPKPGVSHINDVNLRNEELGEIIIWDCRHPLIIDRSGQRTEPRGPVLVGLYFLLAFREIAPMVEFAEAENMACTPK